MSRRKLANCEDLLSHNIIIRVSESLFKKLEKLRRETRSPSIAEVCRKILTNQKIKLYNPDAYYSQLAEFENQYNHKENGASYVSNGSRRGQNRPAADRSRQGIRNPNANQR